MEREVQSESKSLWENPVKKLYTLSYGFRDNNSYHCNIKGYDVKITKKQAKLTMFLGGRSTKVYKKNERFEYNIQGLNGYYNNPSKILERFKRAVKYTKETEYKNRPPAKLEKLDTMVASLEKQVSELEV